MSDLVELEVQDLKKKLNQSEGVYKEKLQETSKLFEVISFFLSFFLSL